MRTKLGKRVSASVRRSAEDPYERAEALWAAGRLAPAFKSLVESAEEGDTRSYRLLAYFYDQGFGTERDEDAALHWYFRAHRAKPDYVAANNIACILRDRKQLGRARWWFLRAVRLGDGDAHLELARLYLRQGGHLTAAKRHLAAAARSASITEGSRETAEKLLRKFDRGKPDRT